MKNKILIVGGIGVVLTAVFLFFLFFNKDKPVINDPIEEKEEVSFFDVYIEIEEGDLYQTNLNIKDTKKYNIEYVSTDSDIATVDSNGIVYGIKNGFTNIDLYVDNQFSSRMGILVREINSVTEIVNKVDVPVSKVDIKDTTINLTSNQKYYLTTTVYPENATDKEIFYETNDVRIAEVTDTGLVIGKTAGSTYIDVFSNNGKTDRVNVVVAAPKINLDSITLMPSEVKINVGDIYKLRTTLIPSNVTNGKVTYTSSNNNIVTVSSDGTVKGISSGTAIVTASSDGKNSSVTINVSQKEQMIVVTAINFNESNISIEEGEEKKIAYTILPSDAVNKALIWTSSNSNIVTVSSTGIVKGISSGTATIKATSVNNISKTINVTVNKKVSTDNPKPNDGENSNPKPNDGENSNINQNNVPQEVILNLSDLKIEKTKTKQIRATVLPLTAKTEITWTSSNESVASVDSKGVITAKRIGETTILAMTSNGKFAKATVVVTAKPLSASTSAKNYSNGNLDADTVKIINSHLQDILEEAAYYARKNGTSEKKAKAIAAAKFMIYNPYYKVPYYYGMPLSHGNYNGIGWDPAWSNIRGVECSNFVLWCLKQAGVTVKNNNVQYYPARVTQIDPDRYWTVDYLMNLPGVTAGDVLNRRYPRDEDGNKLGNGHWALITEINKEKCTVTIAHATSPSEGIHYSTYKCGTTLYYNRIFATEKY